jgi:hypothetical protein
VIMIRTRRRVHRYVDIDEIYTGVLQEINSLYSPAFPL